VLNKNIRSGAKGCKNDNTKTKTKTKDGEKIGEERRKKDKTKWSGNQNTTRGFTPHMQVLEAPENTGALDRYLCVLAFVMRILHPSLPHLLPPFPFWLSHTKYNDVRPTKHTSKHHTYVYNRSAYMYTSCRIHNC